jgi:hypothetical protein
MYLGSFLGDHHVRIMYGIHCVGLDRGGRDVMIEW